MVYDDLMNTSTWAGPGDQYPYSQVHHPPAPDHYQYPATQPSYGQFDLSQQHQQQAYARTAFPNPIYTSNQHARPADVFGPTSFSVDPSLYNPAPFQQPQNSFAFPPQSPDAATVSPHSLQYNIQANPPLNRDVSSPIFQPSSNGFEHKPEYPFSQGVEDRSAAYFNGHQNNIQQRSGNTVQYPSLPNGAPTKDSKQNTARNVEGDQPSSAPRPHQSKPTPTQSFLRVTEPNLYAFKSSSSRPRFDYAPYVAWQDETIQVAPGLKSQSFLIALPYLFLM